MRNDTFSLQMKNLRANNNLTMDAIADELKVTKSAVSMWENHGVVPREGVLREIARKYNVSIDTLLTGKSFKEQENPLLNSIMMNLSKMDDKRLSKAEKLLSIAFDW